MSNIHTRAINLARRYSERNENDLLQESFCDESSAGSFAGPGMSEDYCTAFLERSGRFKNHQNSEIPRECEKFANIRATLQRRRTTQEEDEAVAFAGMDANSALEARRARAHGSLNGAQIRRRMTSHDHETRHKTNSTSWFF